MDIMQNIQRFLNLGFVEASAVFPVSFYIRELNRAGFNFDNDEMIRIVLCHSFLDFWQGFCTLHVCLRAILHFELNDVSVPRVIEPFLKLDFLVSIHCRLSTVFR